MKSFVWIYFFLSIILSGCALGAIEGLEAAEILLLSEEEALLTRAGLRLSRISGQIAIANEDLFFAQLRKVKIDQLYFKKPRLYIVENGSKRYFGEVTNSRTIQLLDVNKVINLPGNLYKIAGDNVNVRSGPGTNYSVFKTVNRNEIVLVLEKNGDWCKVQINETITGYIHDTLLDLLTSSSNSNNSNNIYGNYSASPHICNACNGSGNSGSYQTCAVCHGWKQTDCTYCLGNGETNCNGCYGQGFFNCNSCQGQGSHNCTRCYGYGYLKCGGCNGYGYLTCSVCNSLGRLRDQFGHIYNCYSCGGYGKFICNSCNGNQNFQCDNCYGSKTFNCNYCNGTGGKACQKCNGYKTFKCSNCNGYGRNTCNSCAGKGSMYMISSCIKCYGSGKVYY